MDPRRDGRIRGPAHLCLTTTEAGSNLLALCERVGDQTQFRGSDKFLGRVGQPPSYLSNDLTYAARLVASAGKTPSCCINPTASPFFQLPIKFPFFSRAMVVSRTENFRPRPRVPCR